MHSASLRTQPATAQPVVASAHTPGPWTPTFHEPDDCWRIGFAYNGAPTGWLGVVYVDADPITAEADARLICAAPELFAFAAEVARVEGNTAMGRAARAAVAKALGRQAAVGPAEQVVTSAASAPK